MPDEGCSAGKQSEGGRGEKGIDPVSERERGPRAAAAAAAVASPRNLCPERAAVYAARCRVDS